MIVDWLLDVLSWLINWYITTVRPEWEPTLPEGLGSLIANAKALDAVLPVTEAVAVLGLIITLVVGFNAFKWGIKLLDWIMDIIP